MRLKWELIRVLSGLPDMQGSLQRAEPTARYIVCGMCENMPAASHTPHHHLARTDKWRILLVIALHHLGSPRKYLRAEFLTLVLVQLGSARLKGKRGCVKEQNTDL